MTYEEGDVLANEDGRLARVVGAEELMRMVFTDALPPTWVPVELADEFWKKVD